MPERKIMSHIRRWSRAVHRDLSFFFGGIVLIYAISGFTLNHKHDFNAEYAIRQHRFRTEGTFPKSEHDYTKNYVLSMLEPLGEATAYTKHYFPDSTHMKAFIRGGSSLVVDMRTGEAVYESSALQSGPLVDRVFRRVRRIARTDYANGPRDGAWRQGPLGPGRNRAGGRHSVSAFVYRFFIGLE